ncbi:MAG: cobalt-precorrin 5A hydrolase, partial [Clostridiales bacterium]
NIAIVAFSDRGQLLGQRIGDLLQQNGKLATVDRCGDGQLQSWTRAHFHAVQALIFIGAAGIAVRAIAPYIKAKTTDPAVIVLDELGQYVLPLLSGHIGGANALARKLAELVDAEAVITTATDNNGIFAVDSWAVSQGLKIINPERIKYVSALLLHGRTVNFFSLLPLNGVLPPGVVWSGEEYQVMISPYQEDSATTLHLVPPAVILGIGCRRGVSVEAIGDAWKTLVQKTGIHECAIAKVCSIDLKLTEPALIQFCADHQWPFITFSAVQLNAQEGFYSASAFVKEVTGCDNVCERSAMAGGGVKLLCPKVVANGVTMALALGEYPLNF